MPKRPVALCPLITQGLPPKKNHSGPVLTQTDFRSVACVIKV